MFGKRGPRQSQPGPMPTTRLPVRLPSRCENCGAPVDPTAVGAEPRCMYCHEQLGPGEPSSQITEDLSELLTQAVTDAVGPRWARVRKTTVTKVTVVRGHRGPDGCLVVDERLHQERSAD